MKGLFPLKRYGQLSWFQNHHHSPDIFITILLYYISLKFYDELHNLWEDHDKLSVTNANFSNKTVAKTYFGQDKVSRTTTMLASLAMWLSSKVLKTLGKIMNSEHPDLFDSTKAEEEINTLSNRDYLFSHVFVNLHSLYNCTAFMNGTSNNDIEAKLNKLHRSKDICKANGFQTVQHKYISNQYHMFLSALSEERKVLNHMPGSKCPSCTEVARNNLL